MPQAVQCTPRPSLAVALDEKHTVGWKLIIVHYKEQATQPRLNNNNADSLQEMIYHQYGLVFGSFPHS